ncbi:3-deoxy-7-phosphoheptulonate synthase [Orbus wheelerorum]|uniref:3-deoxy-7-phosphoheptulonate synthase n=1 Tax=Orbus wheelerorum TaxID=3074111 RepID=UPI00370DB26A
MLKDKLNNIRIKSEQQLITPDDIKKLYPLNTHLENQIAESRQDIVNILERKDPRLLVVCGPCSVHDSQSAIEYAHKLKKLSDELSAHLFIVMRVYFEKPRTTVGWKGLINDPHMDSSFDIEYGLKKARKLLLDITEIGLPIATEALDPNTPQYIGDLISWSAIGARTTESQTHREMASGLSMPVGFKNGTDGNLDVAINAMKSASMPHRFVGMNQQGQVSVLQTDGNPHGHVILRGGKTPNFDAQNVTACEAQMSKSGLRANLMIDCSHGNSNKDYRRQSIVADSIIEQIKQGNNSIIGVMIESNLCEGSQSSEQPKNEMKYGVSVTDACISWDTTEQLLRQMSREMSSALIARQK